MRLLPRIVKFYEVGRDIEAYDYSTEFPDVRIPAKDAGGNASDLGFEDFSDEFPEENSEDAFFSEDEEETQQEETRDPEEVLEEARQQAEEILQQARLEAEELRKNAYEAGYEKGSQEGMSEAYQEYQAKLDRECNQFLDEFESVIKETEETKQELFMKYRQDLKNLAISVGEKVIHISLKSCGDVIEKMIISATEKLKTKEWAKIYIAKCDSERMVEGDAQLLNHISHLSKHVKIIVMENEAPGTCIIELPDEIIDASAATQVENIKEILNHANI